MKSKNERQRQRRTYARVVRAEHSRKFGKSFCDLTLRAARAADGATSHIYSATFFSRYNISIPDQQYRSLRLCHALCATGIVTRDKKVAIVGAGISGMTCAVALSARSDCIVHVFESDHLLLRRFREAPFRYLHPDLNQWAIESPINRYNPARRTLFPFMNWSGGYAPLVAEQLAGAFHHYRSCLGIALGFDQPAFEVFGRGGKPMLVLDSPSFPAALLEAISASPPSELDTAFQKVRKDQVADAIEYDVIIVATGFGKDKQLRDSESKRPLANDCSYWQSGNPDFYRAAGFKEGKRKRILISGNGESGMIELAHYLIRDFEHHRIFEFLPLTNISPELWFRFCGVVGNMRYRKIELGCPEEYGLAGPVSWYWGQRAAGFPRTAAGEAAPYRVSRVVRGLERKIYDRIDAELGGQGIGAPLAAAVIESIEKAVDGDLSAMASHEIEDAIEVVFDKRGYNAAVVSAKFKDEFCVLVAGPSPTVYSRRQSPMGWYMVRLLREFGKFEYKQAMLKTATFIDGAMEAEFEGGEPSLRFDAVVVRTGPDYKAGLYGEFRRAEAAFSAYTIAGNPGTGDELPFHIENETRSKEGYRYFLTSYFRTLLWRRAIGRAAPFEDLNEEDDLNGSEIYLLNCADRLSIMIHRRGDVADRKMCDALFRKLKAAQSHRVRLNGRQALERLGNEIARRRAIEISRSGSSRDD
ncbi:hypothetical protein ACVIGB_004299 [Bradyrhizobium sp. USDA 4341]